MIRILSQKIHNFDYCRLRSCVQMSSLFCYRFLQNSTTSGMKKIILAVNDAFVFMAVVGARYRNPQRYYMLEICLIRHKEI